MFAMNYPKTIHDYSAFVFDFVCLLFVFLVLVFHTNRVEILNRLKKEREDTLDWIDTLMPITNETLAGARTTIEHSMHVAWKTYTLHLRGRISQRMKGFQAEIQTLKQTLRDQQQQIHQLQSQVAPHQPQSSNSISSISSINPINRINSSNSNNSFSLFNSTFSSNSNSKNANNNNNNNNSINFDDAGSPNVERSVSASMPSLVSTIEFNSGDDLSGGCDGDCDGGRYNNNSNSNSNTSNKQPAALDIRGHNNSSSNSNSNNSNNNNSNGNKQPSSEAQLSLLMTGLNEEEKENESDGDNNNSNVREKEKEKEKEESWNIDELADELDKKRKDKKARRKKKRKHKKHKKKKIRNKQSNRTFAFGGASDSEGHNENDIVANGGGRPDAGVSRAGGSYQNPINLLSPSLPLPRTGAAGGRRKNNIRYESRVIGKRNPKRRAKKKQSYVYGAAFWNCQDIPHSPSVEPVTSDEEYVPSDAEKEEPN